MVSDEDQLLSTRIEQAIEGAVARVMNGRHPDLPPLWWTAGGRGGETPRDQRRRISGHPPYGVTDEEAAVVRRWAAALSLTQVARADLVEFVGEVEGVAVRVWCWR